MSRLPIVIIIINNNNNSHNGGDSQRCFISPQAIATSRASAAADTIMTYSYDRMLRIDLGLHVGRRGVTYLKVWGFKTRPALASQKNFESTRIWGYKIPNLSPYEQPEINWHSVFSGTSGINVGHFQRLYEIFESNTVQEINIMTERAKFT